MFTNIILYKQLRVTGGKKFWQSNLENTLLSWLWGEFSCTSLLYSKTWNFPVLQIETLRKSLGNTSRSSTFSLYSPICDYALTPMDQNGKSQVSWNNSQVDGIRFKCYIYLSCLNIANIIFAWFNTINLVFMQKMPYLAYFFSKNHFQFESCSNFDHLSYTQFCRQSNYNWPKVSLLSLLITP